jgi:hypothetical protein
MPSVTKLAAVFLVSLGCPFIQSVAWAKTITFLGKTADQTNYSQSGLDFGKAGFWFAQFNATNEVSNRPTNENDRNSLPAWALMNFTTDVADPTRTFSLDSGGVKSEGGDLSWNNLRLPSGEVGLSGSVVDPQTANNSNNTVNRILLGAGVPQTFLLRIVVDNTNNEHDPANRINARGEVPAIDMRINTTASDFNGVADVYTFVYDGWAAGDFIKLQFNSGSAVKTAGFAGLMFDAVPEPSATGLAIVASIFIPLVTARSERFWGRLRLKIGN